MFKDFINHYSSMDDKQIAKDVKKSIDDLTNGNTKGKSFGAFVVKAEQDRIAKLSKMKSEAGRKGGLASAAARQRLLNIANKNLTAEKTTNDQVPIDATTPLISTNASQEAPTRKAGDEPQPSSNGSLRNPPPSCDDNLEAEARESLPAGERGKRSRAISRPVDAPAGSQAHAFGEFGLVKLTEQQATSLRTYYGTDFDRAVGILENYILSLPSKNDGDEKGNAKYWREDYTKRNHFAVMRRDNWVDSALKKAKAADTNLENANGRKSFQEKDRDDRSKWLNSSMFSIQEAV